MTKLTSKILLIPFLFFISCEFLGINDSKLATQGEYLYYVSGGEKNLGAQIFRYSLQHEKIEELTSFKDSYSLVFDISPNGERLVIKNRDYSEDEGDLFIYEISSGNLKKLEGSGALNPFDNTDTTFIHVKGRFPVWSPNGRYIAYSHVSLPSFGYYDNYIFDTKNKTIHAVEINSDNDIGITWSSDSDRIFFRKVKNRTSGMYVSDINGENLRELSEEFGLINTDYSEELIICVADNEIHLLNVNTNDIDKKYDLNIPDLDSFNIVEFINKKNRLLISTSRKVNDDYIGGIYLFNLMNGEAELVYENTDDLDLSASWNLKYYNPYLTGK